MKSTRPQPLDKIIWIDRSLLKANNYNPNKVAPPEMQLLKTSILETGWTQPIVVDENYTIIDGFHRYMTSADKEVFAMTDGKVPVVMVTGIDEVHKKMATIRHNRARGSHAVLSMSKIVSGLITEGLSNDEIGNRLGMEAEEIYRLATKDGMPVQAMNKQPDFSPSWIPKED